MAARKKVAFFDIDGTVFRSSILIELVERFIELDIFPKDSEKVFKKSYTRWLDRKGGYEDYIGNVVKAFEKYIKGVPYADFADISKEVIIQQKDHTYRFTRDLIRKLKRNGYFLIAISQSPKVTLDLFCKRLGFNKVYGRLYEIGPQNRFTGIITDEHLIANKANIVKRAVEKENLTLAGSIAVGDTEGDISMLELVERPIVFNPNQKLYRYARINKWEIVVERKDVIYELS